MSKSKTFARFVTPLCLVLGLCSCSTAASSRTGGNTMPGNGRKLLGNNNYPAICYSGHRKTARTIENTPSVEETREDLMILSAMGFKIVRTYNTTEFPHAERILQSIRELKQADPDFEMYVMLGSWIQCKNAFREGTDHSVEDLESNQSEIEAAIRLAAEYPDTVKIIAVGNEAMVDWQAHFVPASIILKWVKVLKAARTDGRMPAQTRITTSDNWAALGGEERYRSEVLAELMQQVDCGASVAASEDNIGTGTGYLVQKRRPVTASFLFGGPSVRHTKPPYPGRT